MHGGERLGGRVGSHLLWQHQAGHHSPVHRVALKPA